MLRWLLNAIKRWALGLATGQLISGYKKEKTFKQEFDSAKGFDKLSVARHYLIKTNKKIIDETKLDEVLESVKVTASQAQEQIKKVDKKELGAKVVAEARELTEEAKIIWKNTFEKAKIAASQQINILIPELKLKLKNIESQLEHFEATAKDYIEEERTEQYRQIASKVALWKKTVSKAITDGIVDVEEKFELEAKIKYLSEKLEGLKSGK